ncbi:acyl-protein synthetase [Paraphaeosphaeria sporulosa]|uniref:Acyl-protein synthetase n=1 Tax=Paraphaeosphaeria sporulosa TaxID=1460663 RepID=A0A177C263_9PLEO|nr:acyl-protein synthetase [Paraphaeosphaeria sporulosa]OAG01874.1 acyl-protein synthetase [Paraphaeosphaeria sporulosa]
MPPWKNIQQVLKDRADSENPGRLFCYSFGNTRIPKEITYTSLFNVAKITSCTIQRLKQFRIGHPILLHFDDHWDVILWFWSVLLAGGLPVLSSSFSNIEEERHRHIQNLSTLLESPICFTRSKFLPLFGNSHDIHLHSIESVIDNLEHGSSHADIPRTNGEDHEAENHRDGQNNGATNLLMLMLTSGSTGNAKAVCFTHEQVLAAVAGKASLRVFPRDRPFLNWIGLDHVAGLLEIHLQALWLGVDQVHVSAADVVTSPITFLELISRHRVALTFAPNFFLAKLVATFESIQQSLELDLSSLVSVNSGGEANDIKTCVAASKLFSKHGGPHDVITAGFGMTETCAGAIFNTKCPEYDVSQVYAVASLGQCIPGIEMRIVTSKGQVAASGELGDLEVRGKVVFKGYYRDETATKQAFAPGHWFRTGDRGFIDSNGNLNLVGRAKEVININGIKIVAADVQTAVENALGDRVARLVVFSTQASHTEQMTVAYIPKEFPIGDQEIMDIARLITQACVVRTASRPLVFALREQSIPLLPVSTLGKISRLKVSRLFKDGEFAADVDFHHEAILRASRAAKQMYMNGSKPASLIEAALIASIAETLSEDPDVLDITPETSLFDIGFTSMHVIKLKYHIKQRLGIDVPVILIMKNPYFRALAADIDAYLRQSKADSDHPATIEDYDPVVIIRGEGSKTPLWMIHPGVGEVLVFIGLAQCLAQDDRPVFALRAAGFEPPYQRFESITQTVDIYTAAICQRQPRGPYALAGYSYGTMLAFEISKRLNADGNEVGLLGSLNLPPHIKQRISTLEWNVCLLHLSHFLGLITENVSDQYEADLVYRGVSPTEAIEIVYNMADKSRWDELKLEADSLARWVNVAFGLQRMASDYYPSGQVKSLDIFYCTPLKAIADSRETWRDKYLRRWADFVHEPPRFHAVDGEHYTMIGADHVASFAQTLMQALKARGL